MAIAAKLDDFGKPAWIAVMVLGFIVWWPVGLAILGFMVWSGRMGRMGCRSWGNWHRERGEGWQGFGRRRSGRGYSGNSAFEEYRTETLRRLEDEQEEFMDYLRRLRHAKDRAEFDQFMTERRNNPPAPPSAETPEGQPQ
jgi:hypothetical protein